MPRTDAQRRFDAMYAIFERAATADPGAKAAIPLVNLVIDVPTLEAYLDGTGDIAVPADPVSGAAKQSPGSRSHPAMWWRR